MTEEMIYVASMNFRGKWAEYPKECSVLNVTSCQPKNRIERINLSPMSPIYPNYKGYFCFENYWQGGKVIEDINHNISKNWWLKQNKGYRRYPLQKNKKTITSNYDGIKRGYLKARKEIYIPEYFHLVKNCDAIKKWNEIVTKKKIVVFDHDGPRSQDNSPVCLQLSEELILEKINDLSKPFGHGYIVASIIANYDIENLLTINQ